MAENSKIEWTDCTFNPWIGCSKVHAGCTNCYAESDMDKRRHRVKWGPSGTRSRTSDDYWKQPLKWNLNAGANQQYHSAMLSHDAERPRVFCASLADIFEDWDGPIVDGKGRQLFMIQRPEYFTEGEYPGCFPVTMNDLRQDLFELSGSTDNLDWLFLTKRPENIRRMLPDEIFRDNMWLGTSVSDQSTANEYWQRLQGCRDLAPVLFLSMEPLLGPIDCHEMWRNGALPDWVIVGGESGRQARPCDVSWIRSIVSQCSNMRVPCFVKQLGGHVIVNGQRFSYAHKKGGDWAEWPAELRVRQFPNSVKGP